MFNVQLAVIQGVSEIVVQLEKGMIPREKMS